MKRMKSAWDVEREVEISLPQGRLATVIIRIDTSGLAQELGWKAYFNRTRRSSLKSGIVRVDLMHEQGPTRPASGT